MLDIKLIREQPDKIKQGIEKKGTDPVLIDKVLELDKQKRSLLQEIETIRAKKNATEKKLIEEKDKEKIIQILKEAKDFLSAKEKELKAMEEEFQGLMSSIPNPPLDDIPFGKDEKDNVVIKEVGQKPKFSFAPKDYLVLGEQLDMIDIKRASKISGSRFGILKRGAAILEIALIGFIFDKLIKKGFIPLIPPVLIKPKPFWGMGYLDKGAEEVYYLPKDDLYLVGTSEQMIGPMHMNEVFKEEDLPLRYVSFSSCFRREAGSYGKDTKGILRVHQFDKIEMFTFCKPEDSLKEHQLLLSMEEEIMKDLKIPYRVLNICTGDLGDPAVSKYDIEAWLPGQNNGAGEYRETHSTSNCSDFQSRRLNIKYQDKETGKNELVHTLNGTALALGRGILAIMENYQTKDGKIRVPRALWRYANGIKIFS
ncbi:MAG: serine--tRNA ligase [Candidatus Pacebacteria bacterium]|jgi:seryl-tRNA synthetase|nr:serine--tRNA ligase [Candidatus Paceibacterota bacterium]MDD5721802.1 serine--tRNA ligase [Candidatus Paceibacterota bacterium]